MIGAGGLGSACLPYLASAGIGKIGIVDGDEVSISNLQRQVVFTESDIGHNKAEAARNRLILLNSAIEIEAFPVYFSVENALKIALDFDILIDCSDRFSAKYLVNDVAEILNKPFVSAAVHKFEGQLSVHNFLGSACYRDLFPEPPPLDMAPNCEQEGILGAIVGIIGSMQALEAIKMLILPEDVLLNKLFIFDGLSSKSHLIKYRKDLNRPKIESLINYEAFCGMESFISHREVQNLDRYTLIDVRSSEEHFQSSKGGLNIPLDQIKKGYDFGSLDQPFVLYCKSGQRALEAKRILHETYGIRNVFLLEL